MPNYDFQCANGHHVEMQVPLSMYDEIKDGIDCPVDGCGEHANKVLSMTTVNEWGDRSVQSPGFALKGRGWHKTDYHQYGPRVK